MRRILLILLTILFTGLGLAGVAAGANKATIKEAEKGRTWERVIGEKCQAVCVVQAEDGSYIVAGSKDRDLCLVKLDLRGEALWEETYGGEQADYGSYVRETPDGGYIITGQTHSFGAEWGDVYLLKTDSGGNKEWEKNYGRDGEDFGSYVQPTADGGYMIVGALEPEGPGTEVRELWLIKTDAAGDLQWDRSYAYDEAMLRGWSGFQTADGGYALVGSIVVSGCQVVYIARVDGQGNELWSQIYSGAGTYSIHEIKPTLDGGYIMVGYLYNTYPGPGFDVCLIKMDESGRRQWQREYGFGAEIFDGGWSVEQLDDGSFMIAGSSRSMEDLSEKALLFKVDKKGRLKWSKTFAADDYDTAFSSIHITHDQGLILAGYKRPHKDYGNEAAYIVKTDNKGNVDKTISSGIKPTVQQIIRYLLPGAYKGNERDWWFREKLGIQGDIIPLEP